MRLLAGVAPLFLFLLAGCGQSAGMLISDVLTADAEDGEEVSGGNDITEAYVEGSDVADDDNLGPPAAGSPCDDGDPCTHGEIVLADSSCGSGTPYACDDGRACTDDLCDGLGDCSFQVAPGSCLVNGTCFEEMEVADHGCKVCNGGGASVLSLVPDGNLCDDQNACTADDVCSAGLCTGIGTDCDDENPCTDDSCDPETGCVAMPAEGGTCGGEDGCGKAGYCVDGECKGEVEVDCDDGNACTADSCESETGCTNAPLDGLACDDDDICTGGDICNQDVCDSGPGLIDCNDGNECTVDLCHPVSGCYHELNDNPCCDDAGVNVCDDGNWCTTDSCDPDSGACFYESNDFNCNDNDPCTAPDVCAEGLCAGPPADCDDGNSCTQDACSGDTGCIHEPLDQVPCDDGLDCSIDDGCEAGECVADMSGCGCQPAFAPAVSKVNALSIGADGKKGSGLDVDEDQATCAPEGCEAGIDNSLSVLSGLANDALTSAVTDGSVILLFEHRDFVADGTKYTLSFYGGEAVDADCDVQSETCPYMVKKDSFDDDCDPLVNMDNAMVTGTNLTAGGPGYSFGLPLPLADGVLLELVLYHAQIDGTIGFAGGQPATLTGVLAGAVSKADMISAIDAVPEDAFPIDKEMVLSMVEMLVTADIDSSGDGELDAASIGLPFGAIAGTITGTAP